MIFRKEINPRVYANFADMMYQLQKECISMHGVGFNSQKITMGQLKPNSELFWFEAPVDSVNNPPKAIRFCSAEEFIEINTISGMISQKNAWDAIQFDREGKFADSPKGKTINVHIASLGTFNIESRQSAGSVIYTLIEALKNIE